MRGARFPANCMGYGPSDIGMGDRHQGADRDHNGQERMRDGTPALIDFGTPSTASFPVHKRRYIRYGDISVTRCTLPPNPGIALGASQFTVAIHQDQPFDMEWRLPESSRIERQRILKGNAHINGPDRPIFQRWSASPSILVIALEPAFVHEIKRELFDADDACLETHIGMADPTLEALGGIWSRELVETRAGGRLFAESLGAFLTLHLFRTYCAQRPRAEHAKGGLGPVRHRRVLDYIEAHLGEDMSLRDLAAIAEISVHHFGVAFKATTSVSPHRFLTERRIMRAKELLLNSSLSVAAIAFDLGFSSHSHFTFCFRKITGTTPIRFRLERLG
jgi:AraC family transcriptional regulator